MRLWVNCLNKIIIRERSEEDLRKRNKEFAIKSAFETLDLISNITELFGKKGEKQAKRAFEVQKAAQIATTLGTTYLSATQAYASQFLPLPDPSSPVAWWYCSWSCSSSWTCKRS